MITMLIYYVFLALVLLYVHNVSFSEALKDGFSVEIIHRDSPKSPFYNFTETRFQRISNSMNRSINRANHFNQNFVTKDTAEATIIPDRGEYFMSYSIGTPPFQIFGLLDTGSDFIWLQCKPCKNCYSQTTPVFDPSKSNTYKNVPCSSTGCQSRSSTCASDKKCEYTVNYADGSYSRGHLSFETLTLSSTNGSPIKFPEIMIGCGHENVGIMGPKGSGIVGLGGGSGSLVSQLGSSIDGKFSYCLPTSTFSSKSSSTSKLNFGDAALVSGQGTVSTPLFLHNNVFYYLKLEAFSVGNKRIKFRRSSVEKSGGEGNIMIDSGTILTFLPKDVYSNLESTVAAAIHSKRVEDPTKFSNLCYKSKLGSLKAPEIIAHFKGANVRLSVANTFVPVSKRVVCFTFHPGDSAMFGNLAQQNFLVGYDLKKKTVSFKPTDCAKK